MDERGQALLLEHLSRLLTPTELEALAAKDSRPAGEVARELAELDFAFFCRYYLRDYFSDPPASCHWDVFGDVQQALANGEPDKLAESLPRGFGKSTIICVAAPLWCIIGTAGPDGRRVPRKHYILIIKDSFDQAKLDMNGIKEELDHNERLRRDFGDLTGTPWGAAEMVTANGVRIEALGAGMKVRGRRHGPYRPDFVAGDDLENDQTVESPLQRLKVKRWWHRAVLKAGSPDCDFIALGTIIHYDCLQASLLTLPGWRGRKYKALLAPAANQDLWAEWEGLYTNLEDDDREGTARAFYEANREAMDAGTAVAWPERFPYYALRQMLLGEKSPTGAKISSFAAEMQNEPVSDEDRLFQVIKFWHWEQRRGSWFLVPDEAGEAVALRTCRLVGACDPSMGESTAADFSALVDVLISRGNRMFVAYAGLERRHPDRIIDAIGERARYWAERGMFYQAYGIESNQFQKLFAGQAAREMLAGGIRLPIVEVKSTANKRARVASLQPDLRAGYVLLLREPGRATPEEQAALYEQLWVFPVGDHDDGPDALEMARTLAAGAGPSGAIGPELLTGGSDPFADRQAARGQRGGGDVLTGGADPW